MKYIYALLLLPILAFASEFNLDKESRHKIGLKIWQNECRGTLDGLIHWNEGEFFPSLGLGHCIWYPAKTEKNFEETFPELIAFLQLHEVEIPSWIASKRGSPWKTKEIFEKNKRSKKMNQLRELLASTIDLQILFLFQRFHKAEEALAPHLTASEKAHLETLKTSPQGAYALIDYINFKGLGLSPKEQYLGKGWGILQVLQSIPKDTPAEKLSSAFAKASKMMLMRRIRNAPPNRKEDRFLKGWMKRLETYDHSL